MSVTFCITNILQLLPTLRCQKIHVPPLIIKFWIFSNPPDLTMTPRLLILRKLTFFIKPYFHFLSLLVLFTPDFHGKIAYCCIYFSFMLYDNLFLFFPTLHNPVKRFLKFQPPLYFDPLRLLNFGIFSDPLVVRTPGLFCT